MLMMLAQEQSMVGPLAITCFISATLAISGIGNIIVAHRAADGRIGPNRTAGIRTRTTRASDEAWLAAHQAAQRPLIIGGWLFGITGVGALLAGGVAWALAGDGVNVSERYMTGWTVVLLLGVAASVVALVWGAVIGQRAAKAVANGDVFTG